MEQGTHHAAAPSTVTEHGICPDRATEQEEEKEEVFSCVRESVCVCVCVCVCVGSCQAMAELSGMRCLLHSLAVGVSIMRVTEGCLCVGDCFSAFCVCMYSMCVCACVFEKHNNIFSLPVFHGDKGWLLRLQPQWQ